MSASQDPDFRRLIEQHRRMHDVGEVFEGGSLFPHAETIRRVIAAHGAQTLLDYGAGKGRQYLPFHSMGPRLAAKAARWRERLGISADSIPAHWETPAPVCFDPGWPPLQERPSGRFDGVLCTDVLEHCPEGSVDWILRDLFSFARRFVFLSISCRPAIKNLPSGENAHATIRPPEWWNSKLEDVGREFPEVECLALYDAEGGAGRAASVDRG